MARRGRKREERRGSRRLAAVLGSSTNQSRVASPLEHWTKRPANNGDAIFKPRVIVFIPFSFFSVTCFHRICRRVRSFFRPKGALGDNDVFIAALTITCRPFFDRPIEIIPNSNLRTFSDTRVLIVFFSSCQYLKYRKKAFGCISKRVRCFEFY